MEQVFADQPLPARQKIAGLNIVSTGDSSKPMLLFIHGSPGSWEGWINYLADRELQKQAFLVAVDRPGFGESAGPVAPTFAEQVARLRPAFELLQEGQKAVLVGHSLGGPIALHMAALYPDKVAGMVLIAASLDPELEAPRWYNTVANWRLVRWAVPDAMSRSNVEMMALANELQQQTALWPLITVPTVIIQGQKDKLVYPANADYATLHMPASQLRLVRVANEGHFLVWEKRPLVTREIQQLLKQLAD